MDHSSLSLGWKVICIVPYMPTQDKSRESVQTGYVYVTLQPGHVQIWMISEVCLQVKRIADYCTILVPGHMEPKQGGHIATPISTDCVNQWSWYLVFEMVFKICLPWTFQSCKFGQRHFSVKLWVSFLSVILLAWLHFFKAHLLLNSAHMALLH